MNRSLLSLAGTAHSEHADVSIDKYRHVDWELSSEDEAALAESIAEANRGEVIPAEEVLRRLRSDQAGEPLDLGADAGEAGAGEEDSDEE